MKSHVQLRPTSAGVIASRRLDWALIGRCAVQITRREIGHFLTISGQIPILCNVGILPLQFAPGHSVDSIGLSGEEIFEVIGLADAVGEGFANGKILRVQASAADGSVTEFEAWVRIDTPQELLYYRHGGILQYVLRQLLSGRKEAAAASPGLATTPPTDPDQKPPKGAVEKGSEQSFPASDPPAY